MRSRTTTNSSSIGRPPIFCPAGSVGSRNLFLAARWREYHAYIKRVIGWSMVELDALFWDEFLAELIVARDFEGR